MTLTAGTTTQIDDTVLDDSIQSARISDTQMLTAYFDGGTTLGCRVLDIVTATKSLTANAQSSIAWGAAITELAMAEMVVPTKYMCLTKEGNAAVLNVSGTTVTAGAVASLGATTQGQATYMIALTSTTTLRVWRDGSNRVISAAVLSIDGSDNVTQGTKVDLVTPVSASAQRAFAPIMFTPTTGVIFWQNSDDNFHLAGQLFTISGSTISSSGGTQTLYTARDGWNSSGGGGAAALSSSECAVEHNIDNGSGVEEIVYHIVSLAGSTLSAGTPLQLTLSEAPSPDGNGAFTNATTILFAGEEPISGDLRTTQLIKDGTTLSHAASDFIDIPVTGANIKVSTVKIADDFALICSRGSYDATVLGSDAVVLNYSWVLGGGQP